jgi:hypothetical protein
LEITIRIRIDPHSFTKLDPNLHSPKTLDPDPHSHKNLNPDPHEVNADPKHWHPVGIKGPINARNPIDHRVNDLFLVGLHRISGLFLYPGRN